MLWRVPQVTTVDGHTYDRVAIERWFASHARSPLTGLTLSSKELKPNTALKEQIAAFAERHKDAMVTTG